MTSRAAECYGNARISRSVTAAGRDMVQEHRELREIFSPAFLLRAELLH